MSDSAVVSPVAFRNSLEAVCQVMCAARDELCELDAAAGDGDLGVTLATGFRAAQAYLSGSEEADAGAVLIGVGSEFARKAPSTIGALLATAFMRAGQELRGVTAIDGARIAGMLDAAATGVAERGRASPGERTVLDAMEPAASAAMASARDGASALDVLHSAVVAAQAGAHATSDMEPRHGRASWIPERARGRPDAGAVAWAMFLAGLEESLRAGDGADSVTRTGGADGLATG
jgi:dihydroxyacetone kinase